MKNLIEFTSDIIEKSKSDEALSDKISSFNLTEKILKIKEYYSYEIFKEMIERDINSLEDIDELVKNIENKHKEIKEERKDIFQVFGVNKEEISDHMISKGIKKLYEDFSGNKKGEGEDEKGKAEDRKNQAIKKAGGSSQSAMITQVSNLLDEMLNVCTKLGGSDIHMEPKLVNKGNREFDTYIRVRFRLNGDLIDQPQYSFFDSEFPYNTLRNVVLLRCELNSDFVRSVPLDGKFTHFYSNEEEKVQDKKLEIRVATCPLIHSQGIVMRILGGFNIPELTEIGLKTKSSSYQFDQFMLGLKKKEGLVLVTGPTGSGKTSTLNSVLQYLTGGDSQADLTGERRQNVKCISCEDPNEISIPTVVQSQVSSQSFAEEGGNSQQSIFNYGKFLKSALRSDPDVVLIGELRGDTSGKKGEDVIQSALTLASTGHQVLSTLHTSSAAETITRLLSEGANIEALASTLNMIVAQRLVKVPCTKCSNMRKLTDKEKTIIRKVFETANKDALRESGADELLNKLDTIKVRKKNTNGCEHCNHTGYKGRTPLFEIMIVNRGLKQVILEKDSNALKIEDKALNDNGMLTVAHGGLIKMLEGLVTYETVDDLCNLEFIAS